MLKNKLLREHVDLIAVKEGQATFSLKTEYATKVYQCAFGKNKPPKTGAPIRISTHEFNVLLANIIYFNQGS